MSAVEPLNSTGHGPRAPILEITDDQWHTGFDVYLMNVIRATRLVAPIMQAQKGGSIVNGSEGVGYITGQKHPRRRPADALGLTITKTTATAALPSSRPASPPTKLPRGSIAPIPAVHGA